MDKKQFSYKIKDDKAIIDLKEMERLLEIISSYEGMMDRIMEEPKHLGRVLTGPLIFGDNKQYKVNIQGAELIVNCLDESIYGEVIPNRLKEDTAVLIMKGAIISVLPEILETKPKKRNVSLVSWNEIGGMKSQIKEIQEMIRIPMNKKLASKFGIKPSKGILLYGPPGCGKTLVAKAVAHDLLKETEVDTRAFVSIKGAEVLSMYVGEAERQIREIFNQCRKYFKETGKQSVVFFDEADALFNARGSRQSSDVDKTIVPTFLAEMDGLEDGNPFLILASNLPGTLDPAVIREGRIDTKIEVRRPTREDCHEIFSIHLGKVWTGEDLTTMCETGANQLFAQVPKERISGALVATIVETAARKAAVRSLDDSNCNGVIGEDIVNVINAMS